MLLLQLFFQLGDLLLQLVELLLGDHSQATTGFFNFVMGQRLKFFLVLPGHVLHFAKESFPFLFADVEFLPQLLNQLLGFLLTESRGPEGGEQGFLQQIGHGSLRYG